MSAKALKPRHWLAVFALAGLSLAAILLASLREQSEPYLKTTSPDLAISNLNSQILALENLANGEAFNIQLKRKLFELLLSRTQLLGSYDDFKRMKSLTTDKPVGLDEYLLKIRYLSAIHDFDTALDLIDQAKSIDPKNSELRQRELSILLARQSRLEELRSNQVAALDEHPSFGQLLMLANIESEQANYAAADQHFKQAIYTFQDTSPFPLAQAYFQRGVMWSEKAGRSDLGLKYYRQALHYLPQYVVANIHCAELLRKNGQLSEAIELLKPLVNTKDPEARGLLGDLLLESGNTQLAAEYIASATKDYLELLTNYPLAFADHAAEFFAGPGNNPNRALELAKQNFANRENDRSYIILLHAAKVAGAKDALCAVAAKARNKGHKSVNLQEMLNSINDQCTG